MSAAGRLLARLLSALLILPIRLYQICLSPLLPPACRFQPTCSHYAIEAIRVHGPFRGFWLAVRRISRCHPIRWLGAGAGYDPVPPRKAPAAKRPGCTRES